MRIVCFSISLTLILKDLIGTSEVSRSLKYQTSIPTEYVDHLLRARSYLQKFMSLITKKKFVFMFSQS